mgnify:CR=1 FL=1
MPQRILYLINPISGTQKKKGIARLAEKLTDRSVFDVEIRHTEYAGHASLLAAEAAAQGYDIVVAVGGDGTVNEVARSLVHTHTALGIVPCGSGNGLARHLRIPMQPRQAIALLNEHVVHELDYGTINDRPFFCTCGVGFDAFISEKFAGAGRRGVLTYIENTLREGLSYKPQTYTIEDDSGRTAGRAFLIACANASQYGNDALIAPHASMKDGLLDVVVMEPFNAAQAPQIALQLFTGTLPENRLVHTIRTDHLHIQREGEGVAHCDGDPFITGSSIEVKLHHCQLRVVVNNHPPTTPLQQPLDLLRRIPTYFKDWGNKPEAWLNKTITRLKDKVKE